MEQFANNYVTTLSGAITAGASSLTLASATNAPAAPFRLLIDSELILVGARTGTACSSLSRGAESTVAASHSNGATVSAVLTAGGLVQRIADDIDAHDADAGAHAGLAPASHTHAESDVTSLVSDLAGKAASSHTHTASQVTDFNESLEDRVAALLVAGSNVTLTYDDALGTLTVASSGGGGGGADIGAHASNSTTQTVSTGTTTVLTFDSERYDTDTIHSTASNTGRLTATTAGKYLIGAYASFDSNATGQRYLEIRLDGTTVLVAASTPTVNGDVTALFTAIEWNLAATHYVEARAFHNSGGNRSVTAEFWMRKVDKGG